MNCKHKEWTWNGKPLYMGDDEIGIPIKCDDCKKKGFEILKSKRLEW